MKSVSGKDLARAMQRKGWRLLRIQGSHHIYGKTDIESRISVPMHGDTALKKGLLHHLLHVAGLTEEDL